MKSSSLSGAILFVATLSSVAFAQSEPQKPYEERKADLKKACDACSKGVKKDPGEWDISAALGFNVTQGNANTTLINAQTVAHREIEQDIYNIDLNGAYGEQEDVETQQYFKADAAYKRLLDERLFITTSLGYFTDDIAQIDYRTTINPGIGYFLLKDDTTTLSLEAGPSYIFQKLAEELQTALNGNLVRLQRSFKLPSIF
jgi:putative salt-induced outer membrane protein YdiY